MPTPAIPPTIIMTVNAVPTVAPVLSTPDEAIFAAPASDSPAAIRSHDHLPEDDFRQMYEIDRTVEQIRDGGYKRVALQFPDELLGNSERVYSLVYSGINQGSEAGEKKVFILADTSYAACCVDEIAAEHAMADVLVHYGRSCLSPTSRLPVIYVFTTNPLDLRQVAQGFQKTFPDRDSKVLLMADVTYDFHTQSLYTMLKEEGYKNVFATKLVHSPSAMLPNRTLPEQVVTESDMQEWSLFHISEPLPSLQLILASRVSALYYHVPGSDSIESATTSPMLRRRYAVLSHARSAGLIGILVNTLNIKHYLPMISHLKSQIRDAGRKSYLVVVGKVNVEKLANFSEIEVWVGIGCWEQGVVGGTESRGWFRPVITPWELGIALGEREWTGGWIADFGEVLRIDGEKKIEPTQDDIDGEGESDEDAPPEYDLRTGRYISTARPLGKKKVAKKSDESGSEGVKYESEDATSSALTATSNRKKQLMQSGGVYSPGAEFLRDKRTWQGLGSDHIEGDTDNNAGALVEEGRSGHASGYTVADGSKH
ncbi:putative diphthamide synthesis protein-domain-containing protein [Geopyxis carbonaria]|nr:putative diphthamide synthesis protein-domain-containing protein [Geopyxis carbonaria]